MSQITINDIKFTNIPNKKFGIKLSNTLTQSNINQSVVNYLQSEDFYKLVNAVDIDWNGIEVDESVLINDTADLIKWIATKVGKDGTTPSIGSNGNWFIGSEDTGVKAAAQSVNFEVVGNTLCIS